MSSDTSGEDTTSRNSRLNIDATENESKMSTTLLDDVQDTEMIKKNFIANENGGGFILDKIPQAPTLATEEEDVYLSMDGMSGLAPTTKPKDSTTNLAQAAISEDGTTSLAQTAISEYGTTSLAQAAISEDDSKVDPYDVINDDLLETNPTRLTFPPPSPPKTPYRVRSSIRSDSYQYTRKSLQPLRMLDVTNADRSQAYHTTKENRQIMITGIPECVSVKEISNTLKIQALARCDDLEDIRLDRLHGEAIVTLRNSRVAKDLLDRLNEDEKLTFKDTEVNVTQYDPALIDPYKLFVIGPEKSVQDVVRYIEQTSGVRPTSVIKAETHNTTLLCYNTDIHQDFTQGPQPDVYKWNVLPVERTKRIRVEGITIKIKPEDLKDKFNSLCKDGSINTTVYRNTMRDYIVTFSTIEDAEKVMKENAYSFNVEEIEISYYYPFLDGNEEYIIHIPGSKKLSNMDKDLLRYLQTSKQYRADLEEIVGSHFGKVRWPGEEKGSLDCMEVICNVDERDRKGLIKIQEWKENCATSVSSICKYLSVHYEYFAIEIESDLKSEIGNMQVENPDSFCVTFEKNRVIIAGETKTVDSLSENIKDMIDGMEKRLALKERQITKVVKLERYKYDMYVKFQCCKKFKDVHVHVEDKQNVILQGNKADVDEAISIIKAHPRQFEKRNVKDVDNREFCLLRCKETKKHVEKNIEKSGVVVVLKCSDEDGVWIYGKTHQDIDTAVKVLKLTLKTTRITLDKHSKAYLLKGDGKKNLNELQDSYGGRVMFQIQKDELHIVTLDVLHQEVVGKVKNFLDLQKYVEEVLVVDTGIFLYIFNNRKRDVKEIIQQFEDMDVKIDIVDRETRKGFMVKGTKQKCKLAFAQMQMIMNDIIRTDKVVNDEDFHAFLQSAEGIEKLRNIQLAEKCVIQIPLAKNSTSHIKPKQNILVKLRFGTCEIKIIEGDITEQVVDYIVNPTDPMLENKRGIGRTLVDKGGFSVQKCCNDKRSFIKEFDSFVGDSGSLSCRGIIHVVLPKFLGECKSAKADIAHAVRQCLVEADKVQATSIAFPMMGKGWFGYPDEIIVDNMIAEMKRYLLEVGTNTFLRCLSVCDIENGLNTLISEAIRKEGSYATDKAQWSEKESNERSDKIDGGSKSICIENVTGSITLQDSDVIVNSTNKDLNLKIGNLSRTIVKEGGEEIHAELTEKYPHGILPGNIAVTSGGKLKCKAIFHGVLEKWDQDQGHAEIVMRFFISECLLTALRRNFKSISFPMLCSGSLQFPQNRVAKIMSEEIDDFEREHPKSSLKTVRIVRNSNEETKQEKNDPIFRKIPEMDVPSSSSIIHHRLSKRMSNVYAASNSATCFSTKINNVTLTIEQGDLTTTNSSVIVNSVPETLNLKSGIISNAILNAAGEMIETEAKTQMETFRKMQLVMTSSGRIVTCQKIVHLKAKSSAKGWKKVIVNCLAEVEKFYLNSVAFPALGTGGKNFSPGEMGRIMADAFREYIYGENYQECLKDIKIVVFDTKMVNELTKGVKDTLNTSHRRIPSFLGRFLRSDEEKDDSKKMVIYIYTESKDRAGNVLQILDDLHKRMTNSKMSLYNM